MVLFVDTTVLVGAADRRDGLHEDGKGLLRAVAEGTLGTALVSDFVLDETITILGRRRGVGSRAAVAFARGLLASPRVQCLFVDLAILGEALEVYEQWGPHLSFTDSTTAVLMRRVGCRTLLSHDRGFDRLPHVSRMERAD